MIASKKRDALVALMAAVAAMLGSVVVLVGLGVVGVLITCPSFVSVLG